MSALNFKNVKTKFNKVTASSSSTTLAASNGNRVGLLIYNNSSADLFVSFSEETTTDDFTFVLPSKAFYEMPSVYYTGDVSGIGAGDIHVTEVLK